jgi:hypothetical protein
MERLTFKQYKPVKGFPVQDAILEITRLAKCHKGIVFKIWNIHGNETIYQIKAAIKQGEVKNILPYLLTFLKNEKTKNQHIEK